MLISAFYLARIERPRGSNPFYRDVVNSVAKLEHYLLTIVGVCMYAYPDLFVYNLTIPNESYRSLVRASGALLLSFGYESLCVKEFVYLADKKKFMQSRSVVSSWVFLLWAILFLIVLFLLFFLVMCNPNGVPVARAVLLFGVHVREGVLYVICVEFRTLLHCVLRVPGDALRPGRQEQVKEKWTWNFVCLCLCVLFLHFSFITTLYSSCFDLSL